LYSNKILAGTLLVSIFGDAYIVSTTGVNFKQYGVLFFIFLALFNFKTVTYDNKIANRFTLWSFFLLFVSYPFWDSAYNAYSYIGVFVAFLGFYNAENEIKIYLKYIFYISILLASIEYVTGEYIFDSSFINSLTNETVIINEKYSEGSIGVFRSKAIFYGPTSFGVFLIGVSVIYSKNLNILIFALFGAFLANSRTGILIIIILILRKVYLMNLTKKFFIFIILFISLLFLSSLELKNKSLIVSFSRISDTFMTSSGSNALRIYFWQKAINLYSNYSFTHLIFGNNGKFNIKYKSGTESGWLSLLVDNGIIGFAYYFIAFFTTIYNRIKNSDIVFNTIIIMLVMIIITYHLSATSNFILWFTIFIFNKDNSYNEDKIYNTKL
jgi:hypothetical protein